MSEVKLDDIVSLAKRRGFIYQGSEVYGGLSGTWDYGPLGVQLKRNIMQLWWKMFVDDRDDMFGVDAAILMNQKVWQASGHTETFTDPLVECSNCHSSFRVDKLIKDTEQFDRYKATLKSLSEKDFNTKLEANEALASVLDSYYKDISPSQQTLEELQKETENLKKAADITVQLGKNIKQLDEYQGPFMRRFLNEVLKLKCSVCGKENTFGNPHEFNLLFNTNVGASWGSFEMPKDQHVRGDIIAVDNNTGDEKAKIPILEGDTYNAVMVYEKASRTYLRPETAQGIFTNYKNVVDSFYPDLPFGLAQQGKAFRNEISPRDFIFRSREFEQMEIEYFVDPAKWEEAFEQWRKNVWEWCKALGLPETSVHELEVEGDDLAHYSKRTIDFEFDFPIGREELLGLAYRTDFDLGNIQRVSGKNMEYRPKDGTKPFVPHVIEPSFGVERALMAVLTAAYTEDEINGEKRIYLQLPKHLAPVKVAVSPLLKNKPELVAKAKEVYAALKKELGQVLWDDNGNIGKRYRRQDEIGTPYCVTIDFQTLEDNTVTVRDRDTAKQQRVGVEGLAASLDVA
jgi:glycyl-tRNA synthetase